MSKTNYTFKCSKSASALQLTSQQVQLLRFIGMFGFVNTTQLNLLWSVIVKYPTSLSPSILSKWCSYNGLCNLIPISAKRSNKKENLLHTTVTLTNQARKWLADINILPYTYDHSAINSHNEQAIETIVQSLYTATFSDSTLASYLPYLTDIDDYYFYCSSTIKGAQLKGVKRSASQSGEIGANVKRKKQSASQKVQIQIGHLNSSTDTSTNKLLQSIKQYKPTRTIDYLGYLRPKLQKILTDGNNFDTSLILSNYNISSINQPNMLSINVSTKISGLRPKPVANVPDSEDTDSNSKNNKTTKINPARFHNNFSNSLTGTDPLKTLFYQHFPVMLQLLEIQLALSFPILAFKNSYVARDASFKRELYPQTASALFWGKHWGTYGQNLLKTFPTFSWLNPLVANILHPLWYKTFRDTKGNWSKNKYESVCPFYGQLTGNYWKNFTQYLPKTFPTFSGVNLLATNILHPLWYKNSRSTREDWNKDKHESVYPAYDQLMGKNWETFSKSFPKNLFKTLLILNNLYPNLLYKLASNFKNHSKRDAYIASRPKRKKSTKQHKLIKIKQQINYSKNLFSQQSTLMNLLGNNNSSDNQKNGHKISPLKPKKKGNKKNSHSKYESKSKINTLKGESQKVHKVANKTAVNIGASQKGQLTCSYYYPSEQTKVEVYTADNLYLPRRIKNPNQLSLNQKALLILIAYCNILIDRWYKVNHHSADYNSQWHLAVQDKLKYPLNTAPVQRGIDLISNQSFDINNYDFRSFNQQFGYTFAESKNLPFVADEMISFKRNHRKHEVFLELDNRTESNQTQIQKIMNYIWYALGHKEKDVDMIITITDGSLKSRKLTSYTNLGRKIGNMTNLFLRTYLNTDEGKRAYLGALYRRASNLHIYITGVSEAHLDIASILLGSNYLADQIITVKQLAHKLSKQTRWNVAYNASNEIANLLQNPELLFNTGNQLHKNIMHPSAKGILRYADFKVQSNWDLGTLSFTDKLTGKVTRQLLIPAQEHELGAIISMHNLLNQRSIKLGEQLPTPLLIYPHRTRTATAIVLPQYTKQYSYDMGYTPILPYLIQPLFGDNLFSHEQLRWLTIQYAKAISNYFLIGAVSQAQLKKNVTFGDARINLLNPSFATLPRSYRKLRSLAKRMKPNEFIDQLCLNEIPLELFQFLMAQRWPQGEYYVPRFMSLPYLTNHEEKQFYSSPKNESLQAFGLDKMKPNQRSQIKI